MIYKQHLFVVDADGRVQSLRGGKKGSIISPTASINADFQATVVLKRLNCEAAKNLTRKKLFNKPEECNL